MQKYPGQLLFTSILYPYILLPNKLRWYGEIPPIVLGEGNLEEHGGYQGFDWYYVWYDIGKMRGFEASNI